MSATVAMLAASNSKSNVYVQMIIFPRTNDGMKSSLCWQLSIAMKLAVALRRQTSAAAAIGKSTSPAVGATKYRTEGHVTGCNVHFGEDRKTMHRKQRSRTQITCKASATEALPVSEFDSIVVFAISDGSSCTCDPWAKRKDGAGSRPAVASSLNY